MESHTTSMEVSYFEQGADRSAARVIPLLFLPSAAPLRAAIDGGDGSGGHSRAAAAAFNLARSVANEVRVHLARGLDNVWQVPCAEDAACHHGMALKVAIETMRDCAFGAWDPATGRRQRVVLPDPVAGSLASTANNAIYFSRLDAAIRALAPAAKADVCVSVRARDLLAVLLATQRRSLLSYDRDMDHRGTHALIAARALLTIAADGDVAPIHEHIDAFADNRRCWAASCAPCPPLRKSHQTELRRRPESGRRLFRASSTCTSRDTRHSGAGTTESTRWPRSCPTPRARVPTSTLRSRRSRSCGGTRWVGNGSRNILLTAARPLVGALA